LLQQRFYVRISGKILWHIAKISIANLRKISKFGFRKIKSLTRLDYFAKVIKNTHPNKIAPHNTYAKDATWPETENVLREN